MLSVITAVTAYAQSAPDDSGYLLNIGDKLEFDLLEEADPPVQYVIGSGGRLSLPLIGGIEIAGLTLTEAREKVRQAYVDQRIFKNPMIELSVVSYRPITVLGDVKEPGIYEYGSFLTIEQAVGLAGGPSRTFVDPEQRLLRRRELEYAMSENEADLALGAAVYARLFAQVEGGTDVQLDAVPQKVRDAVNPALFASHAAIEKRIIETEAENNTTQVELLKEAIVTGRDQLELIQQRETYAEEVVDAAKATIERTSSLRERGLISEGQSLQSQQQLSTALADLVGIGEAKNAMRREIGRFQRELSALESTRLTGLMAEQQTRGAELEKLISRRQSIQDQLDLIGQWIAGNPGGVMEDRINYVLRRRGRDGKVVVINPEPFEEILPGDILTVSVLPLESPGRTQ